jgi:hypothetical protein
MFCVTEAAIRGTLPNSLQTKDLAQQQANANYTGAWAGRLAKGRTDCLAAV